MWMLASQSQAASEERARKVAAALVIPAGFSPAAVGATPDSLQTMSSVNNRLAASVTESIASSFVAQINADRLSVAPPSPRARPRRVSPPWPPRRPSCSCPNR